MFYLAPIPLVKLGYPGDQETVNEFCQFERISQFSEGCTNKTELLDYLVKIGAWHEEQQATIIATSPHLTHGATDASAARFCREDLARELKLDYSNYDSCVWLAYTKNDETGQKELLFALDLSKYEYTVWTREEQYQFLEDLVGYYGKVIECDDDDDLTEYPYLRVSGFEGSHLVSVANRITLAKVTESIYGCPTYDREDADGELTLEQLVYDNVSELCTSLESYLHLSDEIYGELEREQVDGALDGEYLSDLEECICKALDRWDDDAHSMYEEGIGEYFVDKNYQYLLRREGTSAVDIYYEFDRIANTSGEPYAYVTGDGESYVTLNERRLKSEMETHSDKLETAIATVEQNAREVYCQQNLADYLLGTGILVPNPNGDSLLTEPIRIANSEDLEATVRHFCLTFGIRLDYVTEYAERGNTSPWRVFDDYMGSNGYSVDAVAIWEDIEQAFLLDNGYIPGKQLELQV